MNTPSFDFEAFPKIPRLNRECTITEKIDGTNASVYVTEDGEVFAGSRKRWITPEADNFGFAGWVAQHREELLQLGPGHHFGEWYGVGIQRGYGLSERRFALFNIARWGAPESRPSCVGVVPVLFQGPFNTVTINDAVRCLALFGSQVAPGYMKPEGIVVYQNAAHQLFKVTIENDEAPKALAEAFAVAA